MISLLYSKLWPKTEWQKSGCLRCLGPGSLCSPSQGQGRGCLPESGTLLLDVLFPFPSPLVFSIMSVLTPRRSLCLPFRRMPEVHPSLAASMTYQINYSLFLSTCGKVKSWLSHFVSHSSSGGWGFPFISIHLLGSFHSHSTLLWLPTTGPSRKQSSLIPQGLGPHPPLPLLLSCNATWSSSWAFLTYPPSLQAARNNLFFVFPSFRSCNAFCIVESQMLEKRCFH